MEEIEKQRLYAEGVQHFKNNDFPNAFAAFDSVGGYGDSYTYLGYIAMNRSITGATLEFAAQCLLTARKKGDAKATRIMSRFASMVGDEALAEKYSEEAVSGLEAQAVGGDFFAAYLMTEHCLASGEKEKAFAWAQKSAQSEYCAAQFLLSQMYAEGIGTKADDAKAVYYLEKAAYRNYG